MAKWILILLFLSSCSGKNIVVTTRSSSSFKKTKTEFKSNVYSCKKPDIKKDLNSVLIKMPQDPSCIKTLTNDIHQFKSKKGLDKVKSCQKDLERYKHNLSSWSDCKISFLGRYIKARKEKVNRHFGQILAFQKKTKKSVPHYLENNLGPSALAGVCPDYYSKKMNEELSFVGQCHVKFPKTPKCLTAFGNNADKKCPHEIKNWNKKLGGWKKKMSFYTKKTSEKMFEKRKRDFDLKMKVIRPLLKANKYLKIKTYFD